MPTHRPTSTHGLSSPSAAEFAVRVLAAGLLLSAATSPGCGSSKSSSPKSTPVALTWADFAGADVQPVQTGRAPSDPSTVDPSESAGPVSLDAPTPGFSEPIARTPRVIDVTALLEPPADTGVSPKSRSVSAAVILESKVGQINGRPVLASEILEPLDGRLRALALQLNDPARWRAEATRLVAQQLWSRIRDELALAEAQSNLTAEQRQGLLFFLGKLQEGLVSTEGGSELQADEALRASTGRGLAEEARDRLDRELIENELRTKVSPRVNISWRQVRQEYERRAVQFNPNPTVTFSLIRVDAANAEAVSRMTAELESATTERFLELASTPDNEFQSAEFGRIEVELRGELSNAQILASEVLNNAARSLEVGQTAGPLRSRPDRVEWIHLVSLVRPQSVSLYEAQLEIESSLREKRFSAEMSRYFDRLASRGSFSSIEKMGQSLMEIAMQRYMPEGEAK